MVTIYALADNDVIFYIGQTMQIETRFLNHKISSKYCRNDREKRINDILISGRKLSYKILEICETKEGLRRESFYISKFLNSGLVLTNKRITKNPSFRKDKPLISQTDKMILQLLADDFTPKEMRKILNLSNRTIETKIQRIKKLLKVKHIAGLIVVCYHLNIIE